MHKGIICGRGGQGIITVNQLLGDISSRLGLGVIAAETHGMAMRGGSVATYIKIGKFASPSIGIGEADFMIAMDYTEALRNLPGCRDNALCIIDTTETHDIQGMDIVAFDATGIAAAELGSAVQAGSILLGVFLAKNAESFPRDKVSAIIKEIFPKALAGIERGYKEAGNE
jgi:indolepyruvate ferredoxin oxidoreductase, beta subunit